MKKLHRMILGAFIWPFITAAFIIIFILMMQFVVKYREDIFGKGMDTWIIIKVFSFAAFTTIPLALPFAVLNASLMTLGNLGENYELAAIKSSGINLFRIMAPLIAFVIFISAGSLYFSFYLVPKANLKVYTLIYDISRVKPSFALKEGHFYRDIDDFVIHVRNIDRKTDMLYKVKIYDHRDHGGNNSIILADSGIMVPSPNASWMSMSLFAGVSHQEERVIRGSESVLEYRRVYFDTLQYQVSLSGFKLDQSDQQTLAPHQYMKNIHELAYIVDSLTRKGNNTRKELEAYMAGFLYVEGDTISPPASLRAPEDTVALSWVPRDLSGSISPNPKVPVVEWFPPEVQMEVQNRAIRNARGIKNYAQAIHDRASGEDERMRKYDIEYHSRWALPIACIVFLFIGAPLGAIIRKGGLGIPLIINILFYILYYVIMMQGRKFAREGTIEVWLGMWLPVIIILPFALVLTWQSTTESSILSADAWYKLTVPFRKFWSGVTGKPWQARYTDPRVARVLAEKEKENQAAAEETSGPPEPPAS